MKCPNVPRVRTCPTLPYCRGSENRIADTLSRFPNGDTSWIERPVQEKIEINQLKKNSHWNKIVQKIDVLKETQDQDEYCRKVKEEIAKETRRKRWKNWFRIYKDVLFRRNEKVNKGYRLCVPRSEIEELVMGYHNENGHFGAEKCYLALSRDFYWPKMEASIRKLTGCCEICQKAKISRKCIGELHSVITEAPNQMISVDLMGPLPVSRAGMTQLFVILDVFSKRVSLFPLKRATSCAILRCLKSYFEKVAKPNTILSDNGTQFCSRLYLETLNNLGVKVLHTSPYFPQGNMVERTNREIGRLLRTYCHSQHQKWAHEVKNIEFFLNNTVHTSTGFTPNEVHFNKLCRLNKTGSVPFPTVENACCDVVVLAKRKLLSRAEQRKRKHDGSKRCISFQPGDRVLVRTHDLSSFEYKQIHKFFLLYKGPYTVVRVVYPNAYELRDDSTGKSTVQNIYNLKPFKCPIVDL